MKRIFSFLSFFAIFLNITAHATTAVARVDPEFDEILSLDIDQLTVTSVSRSEKKLKDVASAIYVISNEDLHRMGVTSLPEALRMVPGMQVAQVGSNKWAVSSRGFNNQLSNKLLVLIDGRTVYTPVFSGVYWDDRDTLIEDIDRIEVIRGPGASLWGANAVNGVINIITKNANQTQGTYVSQAIGTDEYSTTEARHGGKINNDTKYRIYAKQQHRGSSTLLGNAGNNVDDWYRMRSGFRMDTTEYNNDSYTFQGDIYGGEQGNSSTFARITSPFATRINSVDESLGGNLLGRWNHTISSDSKTSLQLYADHYVRDEAAAQQMVSTADMDFQHNLTIDNRNHFIWGAGYRFITDSLEGMEPVTSFRETNRNYSIFSTFFQNEYAVIADKLFLTVGSKFEHNDYSGFEYQPNARVSWKVKEDHTLWAAVSRAVRTPSRIEDDLVIQAAIFPNPTRIATLFGNTEKDSEELIAYEVGYRVEPTSKITIDNTAFYNVYDKLTTAERGAQFTLNGDLIEPYFYSDLGKGVVYGFESAATWSASNDLRIKGSYSFSLMDLDVNSPSITNLNATEKNLPKNQFSLISYYNIMPNLHFDNMLYYVDELQVSSLNIPSYYRLDSRLGWEVSPGIEASVVGRNLLDARHPEFAGNSTSEIDRSIIGRVTWNF